MRWFGLLLVITAGCASHLGSIAEDPSVDSAFVTVENPLYIPTTDRDLLWRQLLDSLDDYFKIKQQQPIQLVGGLLTQGRIETRPLVGASWFEPWRRDSVSNFERTHATLQSIRRHAVVEVIPSDGGYLVHVIVSKELEDIGRSPHFSAGDSALRYDGTIGDKREEQDLVFAEIGWIPLGRDLELENRIIADIQSRLSGLPAGGYRLPPVPAMPPPSAARWQE